MSMNVDNVAAIVAPGKTVVSVAMIKEYTSGNPVFVRCYRKSSNWTLPFIELDYTNTSHPINAMAHVVGSLELGDFDVKSAEPIVDVDDRNKPARFIMYLLKVGNGVDAYQMYVSHDDEKYRVSRFMHQNQLFSVLKGALLNIYVDYLRSS